MKYIGNYPEQEIVHTTADRYDYVFASDPTITINPSILYATWLNSATGEVFTCVENTIDFNFWAGSKLSNVGFPSTHEVTSGIPFYKKNFSSLVNDIKCCCLHNNKIYFMDNTTDSLVYLPTDYSELLGSISLIPTGIPYGYSFTILGDVAVLQNTTGNTFKMFNIVDEAYLGDIVYPTGTNRITTDGTNIIVTEYADIVVYSGLTLTELDRFSLGFNADQIVYDGVNLIACNNSNNLIYVYDKLSATLLHSYYSNFTFAIGIVWNNNRLNVIEGSKDVFFYRNIGEV